MPIYEYQCEACSEVVEAWQSLKDEPMKECPACSGALKKLVSMSSFQLKGGGWYSDGYGSSRAGSCGGKACSAASGGASSSESGCGGNSSSSCGGCAA